MSSQQIETLAGSTKHASMHSAHRTQIATAACALRVARRTTSCSLNQRRLRVANPTMPRSHALASRIVREVAINQRSKRACFVRSLRDSASKLASSALNSRRCVSIICSFVFNWSLRRVRRARRAHTYIICVHVVLHVMSVRTHAFCITIGSTISQSSERHHRIVFGTTLPAVLCDIDHNHNAQDHFWCAVITRMRICNILAAL